MRLHPSDPDIETIVSRIRKGDLDLQPDFQRGEVWSDAKKQRLIDSILRGWHVPPIHVVSDSQTKDLLVLDGQQRLASIRDFVDGRIKVNGNLEPFSEAIAALHGLTHASLPAEWRRQFDQFPIRQFTITDYEPDEPAELFFRLNQPTSLTAAEQRNAFFGPARAQVKGLVEKLQMYGLSRDFLGFSNSRMAYDDVIARVCCTIENGTIEAKVTARNLSDRYRSSTPFPDTAVRWCDSALETLAKAAPFVEEHRKFNKATLFSWLLFIPAGRRASDLSAHHLAGFLTYFAKLLAINERRHLAPSTLSIGDSIDILRFVGILIDAYIDRSTARVADVASVAIRDAVLWVSLLAYVHSHHIEYRHAHPRFCAIRETFAAIASPQASLEDIFPRLLETPGWGQIP